MTCSRNVVAAVAASVAMVAGAQVVVLEESVVLAPRVANPLPPALVAMPVTALRFEPRVDVQARNSAEAQADVAIRGGIFENTAFRVAGLALYDPQTGHYTAEVPLAPAMLWTPRVATGVEHALAGFNATAGSVAWEWAPVREGGELAVGAGANAYLRMEAGVGYVLSERFLGGRLMSDVHVARSEGDGGVAGGDHELSRVAARVQLERDHVRTTLAYGYQAKFFGWPNLYTPFNRQETENLQTQLLVLTHRAEVATGWYEVGGAWRKNRDRYTFDRNAPVPAVPFQHETQVGTVSAAGGVALGGLDWNWRTVFVADTLDSLTLTQGRFSERRYWQAGVVPGKSWEDPDGSVWSVAAGVVYTDTDRDEAAFSPVGELAWQRDELRLHASYSETTQVAGYTALNSNPAAGLFRGNPDLGRAVARSVEAGLRFDGGWWRAEAAVFRREDRELTDWVFRFASPNARSARAVDLETLGTEVLVQARWSWGSLTLAHAWLERDADYRGEVVVDASFYALNFPRQRATAAVVLKPHPTVEVRIDNEWREQEPNHLRRSGSQAFLTTAGVYWFPPNVRGLEVHALVDNAWDDDFEEVPGTPAAPRDWQVGATWRW